MSVNNQMKLSVQKTIDLLQNMLAQRGLTISERLAVMDAIVSMHPNREHYLNYKYTQLPTWVEHYNDGLIHAHEFMAKLLQIDVVNCTYMATEFHLEQLAKLETNKIERLARRLAGPCGLVNADCPWTALVNKAIEVKKADPDYEPCNSCGKDNRESLTCEHCGSYPG